MAITFSVTDAAHRYGLDQSAQNFAVTASPVVGSSTSWAGAAPPLNQPVSMSTHYASGFTNTMNFTMLDSNNLVLSGMSLRKTDTGETMWSLDGSISVNIFNLSGSLADGAFMAGADNLNGNSFDNSLRGWGGNDRYDGGGGTDTAILSGGRSQYTVSRSAGLINTSGPDGSDTLFNMERLKFDDQTLAFDTDGTAGKAYRLYQAAFDRVPDLPGLGFQTRALDAGQSLKSVAQNFLNSPEFSRTYGGLSDTQYATQLYENVLHRPPEQAGLAFHVNALSTGTDRAQLLVNFSESPENQAAVIGVISNGITFI